MKKFQFAVLALAAVCMIACDKKKDEPKPQPQPEPEPEYVSPVTIDGSATEYSLLPNVFEALRPAVTEYEGLKAMKVYADQVYINIWAEFDTEVIDINENLGDDEFGGKPGVPFHVYFSKDATNGYTGQWNTPCFVLAEGFLFEAGAPAEAYAPNAFQWSGEEPSGDWLWGEISTQLVDASKITATTVEFRVMVENLPFKAEGQVFVGIDIQKAWDSVGILPRLADEEDPESGAIVPGVADMANVTINNLDF